MSDEAKQAIQALAGNGEAPHASKLDTVEHKSTTTTTGGLKLVESVSVSQQYDLATEAMKDCKKIVLDETGEYDQNTKRTASHRFHAHKANNRGEAQQLIKKAFEVDPYSISDEEERASLMRKQRAGIKSAFRCADKL